MAAEQEGSSSGESAPLGVPATSSGSAPRSLGRRTAQPASTSDNPLAAADAGLSASPNSGQYAVYSSSKKRSSILGSSFEPPAATELATSPSPAPPSPSTPSTPPFAPTARPSVPPLISRPSNSTLPATSGRPYARSVSEARSMLQGQVLRSEVQSLGLGNDSTGAAMIQKLAGLSSEPEWAGVLKALATGNVTLLLPAEKMLPTVQLTPALFLDHMALFESPSGTSNVGQHAFATLSGFRGRMESDELIFASCGDIASASKRTVFPDFADPDVQKSIRGPAFPPLAPGSAFPSTMLISPLSTLSIPRTAIRPTGSSTSSSSTIGRASAGSRLAALFAKPLVGPAPDADLPPVVPAPAGLLDGTARDLTPSVSDAATPSRPQITNLEIPVLAVGKIIRHTDLIKAISKALETHLRSTLRALDGCDDSSLLDRACAFAARFQPPSSWNSADDISHAYQDLTEATRSDLNRTLKAQLVKEKRERKDGEAAESELEQEDYVSLEEKADSALEGFEEAVTSILYDRIFVPHGSSDAQEDENLASRIAALNMLELSLEHLGVDLSSEKSSDEWGAQSKPITDALEDLTAILGEELARLEGAAVRTPKAKLDVFVNLHKIVVDQLSGLPPIPLKKEVSTPAAPGPPAEVEMDDASIRTGTSRSSSRPTSPPPALDSSDVLRTPRPPVDSESGSEVPEISLPSSELASSVHEAPSSSLFDSPKPTPPTSVFDSSASSVRDGASSPNSSSSSADLILPLLIYAVVKHNPRLPSHLKYAQRFRAESLLRGESSYCSTNMQAVIEFLNTVDVSSLGLSSQKVLAYTGSTSAPVSRSRASTLSFGVGGRKAVISPRTQDIDQFVDSANHALVRAADLLFGPKGLGRAPKTIEDVKNVLDGAGSVASKARGTLLRRATASSVVLPTVAQKAPDVQKQKEMVDFVPGSGDAFDQGATEEYSAQPQQQDDDARSVRSLSSMLSSGKRADALAGEDRPSLGDRLASIPGLGRFAGDKAATISGASTPSQSQRNPLFAAFSPGSSPVRRSTITSTSGGPLPLPSPAPSAFSFFGSTAPASVQPVQRFMDCSAEDLRLGEVGELLREYRKIAAALEALRVSSGAVVE